MDTRHKSAYDGFAKSLANSFANSVANSRGGDMTRLFLSGPLFTVAERDFNAGLARFLTAQGFEIWLPQARATRGSAKAIFQSCVKGIVWADAVVACMDGPDPDSGTAWEVGYAYAKGKPIICYRSDFRSGGDTKRAPYNLMLSEAASARVELALQATAVDLHRRVLAQVRKALRVKPAKR
jgi:nucleoside 2-deoxyribosyltransferase